MPSKLDTTRLMESDVSAKKEYQRLRCNNKAAADGTSREAAHTVEAVTAVDNRADTDTADSKAGAEQEADTVAGDSNRNTTEMTPPDGIKVAVTDSGMVTIMPEAADVVADAAVEEVAAVDAVAVRSLLPIERERSALLVDHWFDHDHPLFLHPSYTHTPYSPSPSPFIKVEKMT